MAFGKWKEQPKEEQLISKFYLIDVNSFASETFKPYVHPLKARMPFSYHKCKAINEPYDLILSTNDYKIIVRCGKCNVTSKYHDMITNMKEIVSKLLLFLMPGYNNKNNQILSY